MRFCPIVPSLLHLVLSAIDGDAERCLSLIFALLQRKERLAALREGSPVSLIATNETQLRMLVSATHKLVLANCGKAVRSIENLAPHDYALEFCSSFFPELPAAFREHALVLWYRNGATAVMRIAIGLVGETVASVSGATSSRDAFLYALREAQKSANISWWMKVLARGLAVSRWGGKQATGGGGSFFFVFTLCAALVLYFYLFILIIYYLFILLYYYRLVFFIAI